MRYFIASYRDDSGFSTVNDGGFDHEALDTEDVLGFTVSSIEPQYMRSYELDRDAEGVVVTSSDPFSEAYDKGLRKGAVILEVNRKRVRSLTEFRREVRSLEQGTTPCCWRPAGPAATRPSA